MSGPHLESRSMVRALGGFLVATAFYVSANLKEFQSAKIILSLLAVSIPSVVVLCVVPVLDEMTEIKLSHRTYGIAAVLGYFPAVAAITIILCGSSYIPGAIFAVMTVSWFFVLGNAKRAARTNESTPTDHGS